MKKELIDKKFMLNHDKRDYITGAILLFAVVPLVICIVYTMDIEIEWGTIAFVGIVTSVKYIYRLFKHFYELYVFYSGRYRIDYMKCIEKKTVSDKSGKGFIKFRSLVFNDPDKFNEYEVDLSDVSEDEYRDYNAGDLFYVFASSEKGKVFGIFNCKKYKLSEELEGKLTCSKEEWREKEAKWKAEIKDIEMSKN